MKFEPLTNKGWHPNYKDYELQHQRLLGFKEIKEFPKPELKPAAEVIKGKISKATEFSSNKGISNLVALAPFL